MCDLAGMKCCPYYTYCNKSKSMAKSHWDGALLSAYKSCTCCHMSWKRGGGKKELVAAPWTSSRQFSHMLWLKVHSHRLLRACLLGSKMKLPPPACQARLGLPSVVCHPRGMHFPGIMYICNQCPLSCAWAHCISCAPSEIHLNSAGGPGLYHR